MAAADQFKAKSFGPDDNLSINLSGTWFGLCPGPFKVEFNSHLELCITVHHARTGEKIAERGNYRRSAHEIDIAEGTPIVVAAWVKPTLLRRLSSFPFFEFVTAGAERSWFQTRHWRHFPQWQGGKGGIGWWDNGDGDSYQNICAWPLPL